MKRIKTIHNHTYSKLIDVLTAERKRLGLSQSVVAKKLGMTQSDISKIESNERRLDVMEFKTILNIYGITENPDFKKKIISFLVD